MRSPHLLLWLALAALGLPLSLPAAPAGVTILIIRHAEKGAGVGLSKHGQERALAYPRYFQSLHAGETVLKPDALFAAKDSEASVRPRLTLEPIAQAYKLPLSTTIKASKADELAALLKSGRLAGRTVLVCWHHGDIPELLAGLGADPAALLPRSEWPDGVYNWLIELRLAGDGTLQSSRILNERLMPDDQREPPLPPEPSKKP